MLKPKKSGIDYSKMDTMSKYSEPKTGRISAMSKDSVNPQLQKKIDAAKIKMDTISIQKRTQQNQQSREQFKDLRLKQIANEAGRSAVRGAQISNEAAKKAARAAAKKKGQ